MNREAPRITESAWRALEAHPWPGNVRELGNVMERLIIYHSGRDVDPVDLGLPQTLRTSLFPYVPSGTLPTATPSGGIPTADFRSPPSTTIDITPSSSGSVEVVPQAPMSRPRLDIDAVPPGALSLDLPEGGTTFDDLEREILVQVLARAENNQSRAARSLGMSESTFRSRMKRLGLKS
jgi:sigma-54 specific flagellar transcriptional regulator A